MKLLHLSNIAGKLGGGVSEVVHSLIQHQGKYDCKSNLWFIGSKKTKYEIHENLNIELNRLNNINPIDFVNPLMYLKFYNLAKNYQIIHQHGVFMPTSLLSILFNKKAKIIISPHGYLEPEKLKVSKVKKELVLSVYEEKNLHSCHCLIACSEQEGKALRDFGLTQPIAILPNGIDSRILQFKKESKSKSRFKEINKINEDTKILLFLSRIHPFKGLKLLLESIKCIEEDFVQNNWIFVIAGIDEQNHEGELKRFVKKLNIGNIVKFVGPQYKEDKINALDSSNCFILPSKGENFGIVVTEALSRGLPVITTKTTPWKHLEDNNCGWWVERNKESFISVILELFECSDGLIDKMGEQGRELVKDRYNWPKISQQSVNIYKWVLSDFNEKFKKGFSLYD